MSLSNMEMSAYLGYVSILSGKNLSFLTRRRRGVGKAKIMGESPFF